MPREDRRITFSNAELQEALVAHGLRAKTALPSGRIVALAPTSNTDGTLTMTLFDDRSGKSYTIALQPEFAAAALIFYCKSLGIPIPRHAAKRPNIVGDNLCLHISVPELADRQSFLVQVVETTEK